MIHSMIIEKYGKSLGKNWTFFGCESVLTDENKNKKYKKESGEGKGMRKLSKKLHRIFSFAMGVILVVETINCSGLAVQANEGSVGAADAIVMDEELAKQVDAAEKADEAAYEAAQAAEAAQKAAEELANKAGEAALETDEDGKYTEEVTGEDGAVTEEPVLKEEIDEAITDAENKVDTANDETKEVQEATEDALKEITDNAEADTAEKLEEAKTAADAAEKAADKAQEALQKAQEAGDQFAAEKAAKEAQKAAEEAQKAADEAYGAYDAAQKILEDAIEQYNKAVADAELSVDVNTEGTVQNAAQKALEAAQEALDNAKTAVEAAKTEYDNAMADNATAQAAAEEASRQAGIAEEAADNTVENLEEKKDVDVEKLKEEKAVKEEELQAAKDAKVTIDAEQDAIIADAQTKRDAADAEIAKYNEAKAKVEDLEKGTGAFGMGDSRISEATKVADKTTSDWKSRIWIPFYGYKYTYYSQSEIDAAKAVVAEYNAAKAAMDAIDIANQKSISATAQSTISEAEAKKNAAAQAVNDKTTEIAGLTTSIATVEDFIYDSDAAVTYDMKDNAEYQKLLEELKASGDDYDASVLLREKYEDAIDTEGAGLLTRIEKFLKEISMEIELNGTEIELDWKKGIIYTNDGLTLMIGKDQQNVQTLLKWENDKLTVVTVDEAEFATYSATFDAVAASQAANKAAEAAAAEKAALDKYNAALAALAAAQARLDAAKLNMLNIATAEAALKKAQANVEATKAEWERAQEEADRAKQAADDAKKAVEEKPVKASFYVLNRGLAQPPEIYSYPAANYSAKIEGELFSGVLDETTGTRDDSYIALYKKGIKETGEVGQYLAVQPTAEQLANIGVVLKDGESISWYVIKTQGDGYHVDGFITGQKFTYTIRYGYTDADNNFVDLADSKSVTVGLGETATVASPDIDEYTTGTDAVTVTGAKLNEEEYEIRVEYTKEATRTVTINYYRGSITGTLLGTQTLEVAVSKVEAYASTIKTNWLNLKKPADCYDGDMVSYVVTKDSAVASIVYAPIPVTPAEPEPGEPEGPVTPEEVPGGGAVPTVPAVVPTVPVNVVTVPDVETPEVVEEPVVEEIEENETPLAPVIEEENNGNSGDTEVVNIEEEEAPLAVGHCWIHWLILILTAVYTVYELVRAIARNKKIKELADNGETVRA